MMATCIHCIVSWNQRDIFACYPSTGAIAYNEVVVRWRLNHSIHPPTSKYTTLFWKGTFHLLASLLGPWKPHGDDNTPLSHCTWLRSSPANNPLVTLISGWSQQNRQEQHRSTSEIGYSGFSETRHHKNKQERRHLPVGEVKIGVLQKGRKNYVCGNSSKKTKNVWKGRILPQGLPIR